jgi:hypothetical protein
VEGNDVGALVTLDLPEDSPALTLPWIITFGPIDDSSEWEPVVCGPYERAHALALAETVVADEELMAVVEPVQPSVSVDEIRAEIEHAKATAAEELDDEADHDGLEVAVDDDFDEEDDEDEDEEGDEEDDEEDLYEEVEPTPPPSPEEVRAGFARIAAKLAAG